MSASRTGARLTPSFAASDGSESFAPAGKSPATMALESWAVTEWARLTRRTRLSGMVRSSPPGWFDAV